MGQLHQDQHEDLRHARALMTSAVEAANAWRVNRDPRAVAQLREKLVALVAFTEQRQAGHAAPLRAACDELMRTIDRRCALTLHYATSGSAPDEDLTKALEQDSLAALKAFGQALAEAFSGSRPTPAATEKRSVERLWMVVRRLADGRCAMHVGVIVDAGSAGPAQFGTVLAAGFVEGAEMIDQGRAVISMGTSESRAKVFATRAEALASLTVDKVRLMAAGAMEVPIERWIR